MEERNAAAQRGGVCDEGQVVGIFFAGSWDPQATRITFAVPIKYGLELMGPQTVIQ